MDVADRRTAAELVLSSSRVVRGRLRILGVGFPKNSGEGGVLFGRVVVGGVIFIWEVGGGGADLNVTSSTGVAGGGRGDSSFSSLEIPRSLLPRPSRKRTVADPK